MTTATMRITMHARDVVRELSQQTGLKHQQVIDNAVENYRRQIFLESASAAYAKLASNAEVWREEQREREAWDETLVDGDET